MSTLEWLEQHYDALLLAALISTVLAVIGWFWFKLSRQKSELSSIVARLASTAGLAAALAVTVAHYFKGHAPNTEDQLTLYRFATEHPLPLVLLLISFTVIYQFGLSKNRTRKF